MSRGPAPALLLVAVLFAACRLPPLGRDPARSADARRYFPLAAGTRWTYRVEDFALRWRFDRTVVVRRRSVDKLGDEIAILEENFSHEEEIVFRAPVQPIAYFWKDGFLHGVYLTERNGGLAPIDGLAEVRILPDVLSDGVSWAGTKPPLPPGLQIERRHRLVFERSRQQVPAGSFASCVRVDTTAVHRGGETAKVVFQYSDWYAPGVGLVRSETWDDPQRSRLRTRIELVRFEAAAEPVLETAAPPPVRAARLR